CDHSACAAACSGTWIHCQNKCHDPAISLEHCGECDNAVHADLRCNNGMPDCPLDSNGQPETMCDKWCLATATDPNNCGTCGHVCPTTMPTCTGGNCQCFVAGTAITMADGSQKPIEQIEVGDQVLSFDMDTRTMVPGRVVRLFENHDVAELVE